MYYSLPAVLTSLSLAAANPTPLLIPPKITNTTTTPTFVQITLVNYYAAQRLYAIPLGAGPETHPIEPPVMTIRIIQGSGAVCEFFGVQGTSNKVGEVVSNYQNTIVDLVGVKTVASVRYRKA